MNNYYDKKNFWRYVNLKIKRSVHHYHVFSVMSILFEEIAKDWMSGKELDVHNFAKMSLKKTVSKNRYDVVLKKVVFSNTKKRVLSFVLSKKVKKILHQFLVVGEPDKDNDQKK